jgi:hypothetical protein
MERRNAGLCVEREAYLDAALRSSLRPKRFVATSKANNVSSCRGRMESARTQRDGRIVAR